MMTSGDREGQIFFSVLTLIMDYLSCSRLSTAFHIGKHEKRLPKNPEYTEIRHGDVVL